MLPGDVWQIPQDGKNPHPAPFPLELPARILRTTKALPGRLVLDPFVGSGTTARACIKAGCRCIGTDIDGRYLDMARRRLRDAAITLPFGA